MDSECSTKAQSNLAHFCRVLNQELRKNNLFGGAKRATDEAQHSTWRISPEPFFIDKDTFLRIEDLGTHLHRFYASCARLYELSVRGQQPGWVRQYLELGKPELIVDYGRMKRFRKDLPFIIRPDILLTENGFVASELDSVPGGFGLLGALSQVYSSLGYELVGGANGIVEGFLAGIRALSPKENPTLAIIVSEESQDYLPEMAWLEPELQKIGLNAFTIRPDEVVFTEDGLFMNKGGTNRKIDIVYRFFELFDLKNIPKIDLILYAVRKQLVAITPPLKSYLEEKLLFALFHHPFLESFWLKELGEESFTELKAVLPETWVLDPRSLPPHAVIPGLTIDGKPLNSWEPLKQAGKKEREMVLKISGFSESAWGSRGVTIGHDVSSGDWSSSIDFALDVFEDSPHIIQRFHKGAKVKAKYFDFSQDILKNMDGRVRLCPYYYVEQDRVRLSGILATICPLDKKLIHGMVDAVMVPTAIRKEMR